MLSPSVVGWDSRSYRRCLFQPSYLRCTSLFLEAFNFTVLGVKKSSTTPMWRRNGPEYVASNPRTIGILQKSNAATRLLCSFNPLYTIPPTSKLILFCIILVNLLGSHTLNITGNFFFNCGILTVLQCTLSTLFQSSLFSPFSPFSPLF